MTDWYHGECTCGHALKIPKGGGMRYIQTVCDTCGDFRDIPRKYPDTPPEMTEAQVAEYLAEGRRDWEVYGRLPTDSEQVMVDRLTGQCACGGRFVSEYQRGVVYRCPSCKSKDFKWLRMSGLVSD